MNRNRVSLALALGWIVVFLGSTARGAAPTLTRLEPSGASRGSTVEVKAIGTFAKWPLRGWVEGKGVTVEALKDSGKFRFTVAADALAGPRWVRLFDDEGASVCRPFVIGTVAETAEIEPNDAPRSAQKLSLLPLVVNGKLGKTEDVDVFAVSLKKGQTLVAAVEARRALASPMDGVLQVVSPAGFTLAQNDDDGLGLDPRLIYQSPADGTVLVRLFAFPATPDSSIRFAGGEAFVYRLMLSTGPVIDQPWPLAVEAKGSGQVGLTGWNLPKKGFETKVHVVDHDHAVVAPPEFANTAEVRVVPHASMVEIEPSASDSPQPLNVPVTLSGRIDPSRDLDAFRFDARKGVKLRIQVEARAIGSPLDPTLRVLDPSGKTLFEGDDSDRAGRDLDATITPEVDGPHRLIVADLLGRGGPRSVYRLTVAPLSPDFALTLAEDRATVKAEGSTTWKVGVDRKNGHDRPIEVRVTGLPEGVKCDPAVSTAQGESAKSVTLTIRAAKGPLSGPIRVEGIERDGEKRVRVASSTVADIGRPVLEAWLTVLPKPLIGPPAPAASVAPSVEKKKK